MRYVFHPKALTEYAESVEYYANIETELAQAFINMVEDGVNRIREFPNRYPLIAQNVRRCLTKKFPYAIIYSLESDFILILAVMHTNRQPDYWKNRI